MTPKILIVWDGYNSEHGPELESGEPMPNTFRIEPKMFGRDSRVAIKDDGRFPFLKDAIRAAAMKCNDCDYICLTRPETIFNSDFSAAFEGSAYHHRRVLMDGKYHHHSAVDLFTFTKVWWQEHSKELPDFIWGGDWYWNRTLLALLRKYGAVELNDLIYTTPKTSKSDPNSGTQRRGYNEQLYQKAKPGLEQFLTNPKVSDQLPTMRLNAHGLKPFAYNPSIIRYQGKLWMTYRWHEDGTPSSKLRLAELNEAGDVVTDRHIKCPGNSREDARLFIHKDELWMSWVDSQWPHSLNAVVKYGKLSVADSAVETVIQPEMPGNDGTTTQKNYLMFDHGGQLFCSYDASTLFRVEGAKVVEEFNVETPHWPYGEIRGGTCPLPYKGKLLRFFHSSTRNEPRPYTWAYWIGAMLMEPEPPFKVIAISSKPILRGSEMDDLTPEQKSACSHFKPKIVFPTGAIEHDGGWVLSIGCNDAQSLLMKIKPENLNL